MWPGDQLPLCKASLKLPRHAEGHFWRAAHVQRQLYALDIVWFLVHIAATLKLGTPLRAAVPNSCVIVRENGFVLRCVALPILVFAVLKPVVYYQKRHLILTIHKIFIYSNMALCSFVLGVGGPAGCWTYIKLFTTSNGSGAVLQLMVVVSGAYGLAFNGSQLPATFSRQVALQLYGLLCMLLFNPVQEAVMDKTMYADETSMIFKYAGAIQWLATSLAAVPVPPPRDASELCPATTVAFLQIFCGVVIPLYISYWHERTLKESWVAMVAPTAEADASMPSGNSCSSCSSSPKNIAQQGAASGEGSDIDITQAAPDDACQTQDSEDGSNPGRLSMPYYDALLVNDKMVLVRAQRQQPPSQQAGALNALACALASAAGAACLHAMRLFMLTVLSLTAAHLVSRQHCEA